MRSKEWTKEKILLVKDIYITKKIERLKQNLIEEDKIENKSDNFDDNIIDKQNNKLVI